MIAHGTHSRYVQGCRCPDCTAAASVAVIRRRHKREQYTLANGGPPSTVEHGLSAYVNWGCRCDTCQTARRTYEAGRR